MYDVYCFIDIFLKIEIIGFGTILWEFLLCKITTLNTKIYKLLIVQILKLRHLVKKEYHNIIILYILTK